ncbi:MAG: DNA alkylation repair protein [Polyangiaceae bacterium]
MFVVSALHFQPQGSGDADKTGTRLAQAGTAPTQQPEAFSEVPRDPGTQFSYSAPVAVKKAKVASEAGERSAPAPLRTRLAAALAALDQASSGRERENLARYGIHTADRVLGVSMANVQRLAKQLGRDQELALALWDSGCYEARLLTSFVAEPERITPALMDRWCREFDNWAVCDTLCFHLFDRVPHAWSKIRKWSTAREEFVRRGAFALLASIAGHDKHAADALFLDGLGLIERAATDDRNFVKKAVNWALRRIGRRNRALNQAALAVSTRLAASEDAVARWVGRGALKELTSLPVKRALAKQKAQPLRTGSVVTAGDGLDTPRRRSGP